MDAEDLFDDEDLCAASPSTIFNDISADQPNFICSSNGQICGRRVIYFINKSLEGYLCQI